MTEREFMKKLNTMTRDELEIELQGSYGLRYICLYEEAMRRGYLIAQDDNFNLYLEETI